MNITYFIPREEAYVPGHIVGPAQTYAQLAKKFNISEEVLRTKNNNEPLFIGKKILI